MNATENFTLVGKYVLNRVGKDKFDELMKRAYGDNLDDGYLRQKWESLRQNELSFLVSYKEFLSEVINEINATGYKG